MDLLVTLINHYLSQQIVLHTYSVKFWKQSIKEAFIKEIS